MTRLKERDAKTIHSLAVSIGYGADCDKEDYLDLLEDLLGSLTDYEFTPPNYVKRLSEEAV